ncbi:BAR_ACAPs and ArfGap_ACAP domain-containing protein [Coregonus clupeaformis]|uniref:BAR_ACAPs and ArfGap_ACAP domain-containing protein n=1 Tax=Coregonus clupeaformis TaxID=59861 RepID=UPI001BDFA709|nr:BAR_ACAPs and ArfGap_ACAP domain-containing protein [Coregonus clupeaformis]
MDTFMDYKECIKDSPAFRLTLDKCQTDVAELQSHVEKVMKLCGKMVESGQAYNTANQNFLAGVAEFSTYHKRDSVIMNCMSQFIQGLQEMINFHTVLFDQTQRAITQQLSNLLTKFIPQLGETRKEFVRIGEALETAAVKNAQIFRHKVTDAERASHLLLATRKCHQHFALDYCLQLNNFKAQQKLDILNSVFSYFHAQYTFFHQGFDLLRDLEPTMKTMVTQLAQLSTECTAKRKDLENTHLLFQQTEASGEPILSSCPDGGETIQGHLFKRSRRKNKTWKRCWFSIKDNQLVYTKSHKEEPVSLFDDLRLCAVKSLDSIDRRFCFELVSVQKCCVLQADSEELKQAWISAVQGSIDMAYRGRVESQQPQPKESLLPLQSPSDPQPGQPPQRPAALVVALQSPGNHRCCDCSEEDPRWASVNLGITMCIECSGIHRSLGVHLSKVRSLTLDSWDPEQLKLLCGLGNDVINGIYEFRCAAEGRVKPIAASPRPEKETWIKEKYVEKRFVKDDSLPETQRRENAGRQMYQAACQGDLVTMASALAQGAEVNWSHAEEEGRTALIGSAFGGSLTACEFLLQNGANVNYRDQRGQGALHTAATWGHTGQVCLLLKKGANQYAVDERGQDPLAIAIETAHADIVTLLRMARMNEEMRDSEGFFGSMGDDETFQDIFRDFSDMASHDPERLTRRQFSRSGEEEGQEKRIVNHQRKAEEEEEET